MKTAPARALNYGPTTVNQNKRKNTAPSRDLQQLASNIKRWGRELGFQQIGISDLALQEHSAYFAAWLDAGNQGSMDYMDRQRELRLNPEKLLPGACRVISARMDYLPPQTEPIRILGDKRKAYVSRYALGRDYHKLIRKRLAQLAEKIAVHSAAQSQRPFVDSAPVLERAFAEKAGLGWIGKNTMLINSKAGSWFFLGELFTDLPLPIDPAQEEKHCGTCTACLDICPTNAFNGPFDLDARKCISYLTIEFKGSIPLKLRKPIGNRVFGCDDCQLVCPWNKFSSPTIETDFKPRHGLDHAELLTLFLWSEQEFDNNTKGSAIRRIGYERWLRNLAIGLGNGEASAGAIEALKLRRNFSTLVDQHIDWALAELTQK